MYINICFSAHLGPTGLHEMLSVGQDGVLISLENEPMAGRVGTHEFFLLNDVDEFFASEKRESNAFHQRCRMRLSILPRMSKFREETMPDTRQN